MPEVRSQLVRLDGAVGVPVLHLAIDDALVEDRREPLDRHGPESAGAKTFSHRSTAGQVGARSGATPSSRARRSFIGCRIKRGVAIGDPTVMKQYDDE